jgi:hypothetical protein
MTSHRGTQAWEDQVEGLIGELMALFQESENTVSEFKSLCHMIEASPADGPVLITSEHWLKLTELRDKKAGIDKRIEAVIDLLGRGQ